jgi:hypothetical protein
MDVSDEPCTQQRAISADYNISVMSDRRSLIKLCNRGAKLWEMRTDC